MLKSAAKVSNLKTWALGWRLRSAWMEAAKAS